MARHIEYLHQSNGRYETERLKARLATHLKHLLVEGDDCPTITPQLLDVVTNQASLPVPQRANGLLRFLTSPDFEPHISINLTSHAPLIEGALGSCESIGEEELQFFLDYLVGAGFVEDTTVEDGGYIATVKGHQEIEKERTSEDSSEVFVAMWFHNETNALWHALEAGIASAGYTAIRIDRQHHSNLIDDEIVTYLRRCRFVVSDLTHGEEGHRGSVYYEAGFARGLNKQVIQTVREDILNDGKIAFDLDHYPTIVWKEESLDDFVSEIQYRIESLFGRGPDVT